MTDPILQPEEHAAENTPHGSIDQKPSRPFDLVTLPSGGKLYKTGPLANTEELEVYYLTAKEEDILTAPNLLRSGKVMETVLRNVLVDRSIDAKKMLLGDRNAILVWLRSTGYGAEYLVNLNCNVCNKKFEHEFNLAELNIRKLKINPDEDGLFDVSLPVTKKIARVSFLTAEEDDAVDAAIENRSRKLKGTGNPATLRLMAYVKEVVGISADEKKSFIENLPVKDSRTIRKFMHDNEPCVIMQQDAKCTMCGEINEEVVIPITSRFFWPDS